VPGGRRTTVISIRPFGSGAHEKKKKEKENGQDRDFGRLRPTLPPIASPWGEAKELRGACVVPVHLRAPENETVNGSGGGRIGNREIG
jgi:hypothetical protein